jgi:hypothetical protein
MKKVQDRSIKTEIKIKFISCFDRILWKLGAKNRKKIRKFLGLWSIEDNLYEILAEEIQKEIDAEILESIRLTNEN